MSCVYFRRELLWYYQDGASFIFPDAFEDYMKPIPEVGHYTKLQHCYPYKEKQRRFAAGILNNPFKSERQTYAKNTD